MAVHVPRRRDFYYSLVFPSSLVLPSLQTLSVRQNTPIEREIQQ